MIIIYSKNKTTHKFTIYENIYNKDPSLDLTHEVVWHEPWDMILECIRSWEANDTNKDNVGRIDG